MSDRVIEVILIDEEKSLIYGTGAIQNTGAGSYIGTMWLKDSCACGRKLIRSDETTKDRAFELLYNECKKVIGVPCQLYRFIETAV